MPGFSSFSRRPLTAKAIRTPSPGICRACGKTADNPPSPPAGPWVLFYSWGSRPGLGAGAATSAGISQFRPSDGGSIPAGTLRHGGGSLCRSISTGPGRPGMVHQQRRLVSVPSAGRTAGLPQGRQRSLSPPRAACGWDSVHITYRYRSATYRFHLSSACTAPVLDGEPLAGGRILLQDDGRIHEATRGSAP